MGSQRDNPVLWLGASKSVNGAGGNAIAAGGNVLLSAPRHDIAGPSHFGTLHTVDMLMAGVFGVLDHGSMGATEDFDASVAGYHLGVLDADCTLSFAGATAGVLASMILELSQDATGGRAITLPGSVPGAGNLEAALDLTPGTATFYVFFSHDGGVTWFGFAMGGEGASSGGFVPTFIASGQTFTVPANRQALFSMPIDNEGILDVEGYLVMVD